MIRQERPLRSNCSRALVRPSRRCRFLSTVMIAVCRGKPGNSGWSHFSRRCLSCWGRSGFRVCASKMTHLPEGCSRSRSCRRTLHGLAIKVLFRSRQHDDQWEAIVARECRNSRERESLYRFARSRRRVRSPDRCPPRSEGHIER